MSQFLATAIALFTIRASELTEGDIIRQFTGDTWFVVFEPEYTSQSITFELI